MRNRVRIDDRAAIDEVLARTRVFASPGGVGTTGATGATGVGTTGATGVGTTGATGPAGGTTPPNFVEYVNPSDIPPAPTISIAAPAITAQGSGLMQVFAQVCPYSSTGNGSQITYQLFRDAVALPPIRQSPQLSETTTVVGQQGSSGNPAPGAVYVVGSGSIVVSTPPHDYAATFVVSTPGVLSTLAVIVESNSLDGPTVLTLFVNGVATAVTLTIPAATAGFFETAPTLTTPIVPGDAVWVILDTTGSTTGAIAGVSVTYHKTATIDDQHSPGVLSWLDVPGDALPHVYSMLQTPDTGELADDAFHQSIYVLEK